MNQEALNLQFPYTTVQVATEPFYVAIITPVIHYCRFLALDLGPEARGLKS